MERLTIHEAAALVGRTERIIYKWIEKGYLASNVTKSTKACATVDRVELLAAAGSIKPGRKPTNWDRF